MMNKKGLSLMEVLISAVLMALLVTGLINVVVSSKRWIIHSRSRVTASQLGKTFLGSLYDQVGANVWSSGQNCLTDGACLGSITFPAFGGIQYNATYTRTTYIPDIGPSPNSMGRLRKVRLDLNWDEREP